MSAIFVDCLAKSIAGFEAADIYGTLLRHIRRETVSSSTTSPNNSISDKLSSVKNQICTLAQKHNRDPDSIQLLAVSKTKPVASIREAIDAGQRAFGENYPDEAVSKVQELGSQTCDWHFIGSVQSRKAATLARHFSWVHSVERLKVASKLAEHRPADLPPLQICLQVNIDNEASKSGVMPAQLADLAEQCAALPQLQLRGLMAIPAPQPDVDSQRVAFAKLRRLFEQLRQDHPSMDTLSMGMSGDLEAAIAEGTTMVRVGTAIFGARAPRPN